MQYQSSPLSQLPTNGRENLGFLQTLAVGGGVGLQAASAIMQGIQAKKQAEFEEKMAKKAFKAEEKRLRRAEIVTRKIQTSRTKEKAKDRAMYVALVFATVLGIIAVYRMK